MVYFDGLGGLIFIGCWIFCFVDVLVTPEAECRTLPKLAWVFIVLLLPLLGMIGWLVAGRNWNKDRRTAQTARPRPRYGVPSAGSATVAPDDDEDFLAGLRKRAEEQRRRARDQDRNTNPDGDIA